MRLGQTVVKSTRISQLRLNTAGYYFVHSHIQPAHILVHLSSPFAQLSITVKLLQSETILHFSRHNKYEAPRPCLFREICCPLEQFILNTLETRNSNLVFTVDRDLYTREDVGRAVDDRINPRIVGN